MAIPLALDHQMVFPPRKVPFLYLALPCHPRTSAVPQVEDVLFKHDGGALLHTVPNLLQPIPGTRSDHGDL